MEKPIQWPMTTIGPQKFKDRPQPSLADIRDPSRDALATYGSGEAHAPRLKALLAEHLSRQTTPVDA
jgi:hypothetical protein